MTLTFVEDVEADMGPTRVIPGSHLGEVHDHYDAEGNWLGLIGEHVKHRIPEADSVEMTGPAGSVLVTSCGIVHAAGENRAARHRPMVLAGLRERGYGLLRRRALQVAVPVADRGGPKRRAAIHSDAQRLKMPPDWDSHQGIRIDNLYQQQHEA